VGLKDPVLNQQVLSFYTSEVTGKPKPRFTTIATQALSPGKQSPTIIIGDLTF